MKNKILIVLALALCVSASAQQRKLPSCVRVENSFLIFPGDRSAQDAFYAKLDSLIIGQGSDVNVWQVGGSHIQAAYFPNRIRQKLDSIAPRGDRGFLFPHKLAKTNSDTSYVMNTTGLWEAPVLTKNSKLVKPRYGITGFGARTRDPKASVSFNIDPHGDSLWHFKSLRVLGYASSERAYPRVIVGADTLGHRFDSLTSSYVFDLPEYTDSVSVAFEIPQGENFVLNGLQPLSGRTGLHFFASGVNGAKVPSWVDQCADLERDLQLVKPDLAIFGLGINDSACKASEFRPEKFKNNYRRLIAMIRRVSPDCAFIFVTNNDSYRYVKGGMTYNMNAPAVRKAMMELAEEFGAGVWDLLEVMGGTNTVLGWRDAGLVKQDKLHFTDVGYKMLGDLFFDALMTDWKNTKE